MQPARKPHLGARALRRPRSSLPKWWQASPSCKYPALCTGSRYPGGEPCYFRTRTQGHEYLLAFLASDKLSFSDLGRIDIVVSNAGYGVLGAAEELTDEQIDGMIATNLVASMQLARAVTPHLREQGGGHILQLSSMGGLITFAGFSLYHVTKFGVEGFFDAFAREVEPFGIRVTLVEPGRIRTSFGEATQQAPQHPAYADNPAINREYMPMEDQSGDPAKVVAAMIEAADAEDPPLRLLLGSDAYTWVTAQVRERLSAFESQKSVAFSADIDGFPHVEP